MRPYGSALLLAGAYLCGTAVISADLQWGAFNLLHLTGAAALAAALFRGWRGVDARALAAGAVIVAALTMVDGVLVALDAFFQAGLWRLVGGLIALVLSMAGEEGRLRGRWLLALSALALVGGLFAPLLFLKSVGEVWLTPRAILINALGLYLGLTLAAAAVGTGLRTALSRL